MSENMRDFLADIVTIHDWAEPVLSRLLSKKCGEWMPLREALTGIEGALSAYSGIASEGLAITWLPHPFSPENAWVILLYDDENMESTPAIVTQDYLDTLGFRRSK